MLQIPQPKRKLLVETTLITDTIQEEFMGIFCATPLTPLSAIPDRNSTRRHSMLYSQIDASNLLSHFQFPNQPFVNK
jgi:hypothetical protein